MVYRVLGYFTECSVAQHVLRRGGDRRRPLAATSGIAAAQQRERRPRAGGVSRGCAIAPTAWRLTVMAPLAVCAGRRPAGGVGGARGTDRRRPLLPLPLPRSLPRPLPPSPPPPGHLVAVAARDRSRLARDTCLIRVWSVPQPSPSFFLLHHPPMPPPALPKMFSGPHHALAALPRLKSLCLDLRRAIRPPSRLVAASVTSSAAEAGEAGPGELERRVAELCQNLSNL